MQKIDTYQAMIDNLIREHGNPHNHTREQIFAQIQESNGMDTQDFTDMMAEFFANPA